MLVLLGHFHRNACSAASRLFVRVEKSGNLWEKVFICEEGGGAGWEGGGWQKTAAHSLISHEVDLSSAELRSRELIASNE